MTQRTKYDDYVRDFRNPMPIVNPMNSQVLCSGGCGTLVDSADGYCHDCWMREMMQPAIVLVIHQPESEHLCE